MARSQICFINKGTVGELKVLKLLICKDATYVPVNVLLLKSQVLYLILKPSILFYFIHVFK